MLEIARPADGAVIVGAITTELEGRVVSVPPEIAGVPLFYRWYSSTFPADKDRISINAIALPDAATPLPTTLGLGRNVLTLAASDKPTEAAATTDSVHGGVAGGSDGPTRCVVTVVSAGIVAPPAGATLSRAAAVLTAVAPLRAAAEDHAEVDRLRYRWRFDPSPADGRGSGAIAGPPLASDPAPGSFAALAFVNVSDDDEKPAWTARYSGPLPAAIGLGGYVLTLRVEPADTPDQGVEVSRNVVIVA